MLWALLGLERISATFWLPCEGMCHPSRDSPGKFGSTLPPHPSGAAVVPFMGRWRFHAEQEAGEVVAADGDLVDDKCGGEGRAGAVLVEPGRCRSADCARRAAGYRSRGVRHGAYGR